MTRTETAEAADAATLAVPMAALASGNGSAEASGQTEQEAALRRLAAIHEIRRLGA